MQWGKVSSFPAVYEELCVPGFFVRFSDALLEVADLRPGDRLLDVATGTGIVLRRAREREPGLERTTGLDLNPGMLAVAREASPQGTEFVEGDAMSLPFADGSFDLVTCQQGLQFFPDRGLGLREFHRVLASGGRTVVASWAEIETAPGYAAIADAMLEQLPNLVGAARNPFALHDPDELRTLLESAGFEEVSVERAEDEARFASPAEFTRSYVDGSAVSVSLEDFPETTRAALRAEIVERVTLLAGDGPHALPLVTNIARGRKA